MMLYHNNLHKCYIEEWNAIIILWQSIGEWRCTKGIGGWKSGTQRWDYSLESITWGTCCWTQDWQNGAPSMESERRGSVESNSTTPRENQTVSSTVKQTKTMGCLYTCICNALWSVSYSCLFDRLLAGRPGCGCTDIRDSSSECFTSLIGSYLGQNPSNKPDSGEAIDCA